MADTVKVAGKQLPKWAVYGGAGIVVVGGILLLKRKSSSSATSAATDPNAINPLTGLPYSQDNAIDPLTGLGYLAEAQQYGSVAAAEAAQSASQSGLGSSGGIGSGLTTGGSTGNVGGSTGDTGGGTVIPPTTGSTGFTSNSDWGQSAIGTLEQLGYSSGDATSAIAAYLAGLTLTAFQAQLVQIAIGEIGPPPNQLPITTTPAGSNSGGSGTPGPSKGGPITVAPTGFRVASVHGLTMNLAWNAMQVPSGEGPLRGYTIAYGQNPNNLPYRLQIGPNQTTASLTFNSGPGAHGLTHYFELWADPANSGGPHAGPISAKTQ